MKRSSILIATVAAFVGGASMASAQDVQVQGGASVTVQPYQQQQPYQQPYGYPQQQPPPGYGQPYGQQYPQQQPYYQQQPQYYPQPVQPQPRYREREESMTGLWVSGVIILPVSWLLTWTSATLTLDASCGFGGCRDIDYFLFSFIPLVGPWFMLAQDDTRPLNEGEVAGALLGGIGQVAGLLMIILGVAIRRTVQVPTYALGDSEHAPELSFQLLPTEGAGAQLGLQLTHF